MVGETDIIKTFFFKEFKSFFQNKMIYVLLPIYLIISFATVIYFSDFMSVANLSMQQFFLLQPRIFVIFIPALTMRLWVEEYKNNTWEILLSQPISIAAAVIGKFLAVWAVTGIMLLSSTVLWGVTAWFIGCDNMFVLANYLMTFLVVGIMCAVSAWAGALCFNYIGAFLISWAFLAILFAVNFDNTINKIMALFIDNFNARVFSDFAEITASLVSGEIKLAFIFYAFAIIATALWANVVAIDYKRSEK